MLPHRSLTRASARPGPRRRRAAGGERPAPPAPSAPRGPAPRARRTLGQRGPHPAGHHRPRPAHQRGQHPGADDRRPAGLRGGPRGGGVVVHHQLAHVGHPPSRRQQVQGQALLLAGEDHDVVEAAGAGERLRAHHRPARGEPGDGRPRQVLLHAEGGGGQLLAQRLQAPRPRPAGSARAPARRAGGRPSGPPRGPARRGPTTSRRRRRRRSACPRAPPPPCGPRPRGCAPARPPRRRGRPRAPPARCRRTRRCPPAPPEPRGGPGRPAARCAGPGWPPPP